MRIEYNNLVYDEQRPECGVWFSYSQGKTFAFVQVIDLGAPHARYEEPVTKRYWGVYNDNAPQASIQEIMRMGGKWPVLPSQ